MIRYGSSGPELKPPDPRSGMAPIFYAGLAVLMVAIAVLVREAVVNGWVIVIGAAVIVFGAVCLVLRAASKTIEKAERERGDGGMK